MGEVMNAIALTKGRGSRDRSASRPAPAQANLCRGGEGLVCSAGMTGTKALSLVCPQQRCEGMGGVSEWDGAQPFENQGNHAAPEQKTAMRYRLLVGNEVA